MAFEGQAMCWRGRGPSAGRLAMELDKHSHERNTSAVCACAACGCCRGTWKSEKHERVKEVEDVKNITKASTQFQWVALTCSQDLALKGQSPGRVAFIKGLVQSRE